MRGLTTGDCPVPYVQWITLTYPPLDTLTDEFRDRLPTLLSIGLQLRLKLRWHLKGQRC